MSLGHGYRELGATGSLLLKRLPRGTSDPRGPPHLRAVLGRIARAPPGRPRALPPTVCARAHQLHVPIAPMRHSRHVIQGRLTGSAKQKLLFIRRHGRQNPRRRFEHFPGRDSRARLFYFVKSYTSCSSLLGTDLVAAGAANKYTERIYLRTVW